MEQVSIALVIARVVQVAALFCVIYFVPIWNSLMSFVLVCMTIVISWLTQLWYVLYKSSAYLRLSYIVDRKFLINHFKTNRKYGIWYYVSSFHTYASSILLSIYFPTIQNFVFVGLRALSLSLVEILLIIPSSIGNSMIHKVWNDHVEVKRRAFGYVGTLMLRFGLLVSTNFLFFGHNIIYLMWRTQYLSEFVWWRWSDTLLPYMGIMILLSFLKQVHNYLFISTDHQNKLFGVNIIWVVIWVIVWIYMIPRYSLIGWIVTQLVMEAIYFVGAVYISYKNHIMLIRNQKITVVLVWIVILWWAIWYQFINLWYADRKWFLMYASIFNIIVLWASALPLKHVFVWMWKS